MPFTLKVSFTGMCLFVPDADRMHVLLPGTAGGHGGAPAGGGSRHEGHDHRGEGGGNGGGHGGHVEAHAARLVFDTAHLRPNGVRLDGIPASISLRNLLLELPASGRAFAGQLPADLVRVNRAIRPEVFDPATAQDLLTSRVTLRSGRCTDHDPGACWDWDNGPRAMSHVVEWSIEDFPGDSLENPLQLLGGAAGGRVGPFFPVNGEVLLEVWHVPPAELPPVDDLPVVPSPGDEAHHFAAFDRLLQAPVGRLPRFSGLGCSTPGQGKFRDKGRVGYSCMSAAL
jgi:hypothetical protein